MDKKLFILFAFIIVLVAGVAFFKFWQIEEPKVIIREGLVVLSPEEGSEVASPLKIKGYVNGAGWTAFEAQVGTVEMIADQDGITKILGTAVLTATTDWMTQLVYFETTLSFNADLAIGDISLRFRNENASGDPVRDKFFVLPVRVSGNETTKVNVFFNKNSADSTCDVVFPVDRIISKTQAVATAAITELLSGPSASEQEAGFVTSINPGVTLQSISIVDGIARVDFDERLQEAVGGSCRVTAIRAQITQTLKQFPTVQEVIISINGETETILQP